MQHADVFDDELRLALQHKAENLDATINTLLDDYAEHCKRHESTSMTESAIRRDMLSYVLPCGLITKKVSHTLRDGARPHLAGEIHDLATSILEMQSSARYSGIFARHEVTVAQSILDVEHEYLRNDPVRVLEADRLTACASRYKSWAKALMIRLLADST